MSTVSPDFLLKDGSENGVSIFIRKLEDKKKDLLADYISYVAPMFPFGDDTQTSICVRYAHRVSWLALNRLIDALNRLPPAHIRTELDVHRYFSYLCIPHTKIYHHSELAVTSDLLHRLFTYASLLHLKDLPPNTSTNITQLSIDNLSRTEEDVFKDTMPGEGSIYSAVREIDDLLAYAAVIDSYPVVPEDLAGILLPTAQKKKRLDLSVLTPGVDNRMHVHELKDVRTCISCKVDNINVGLTDVEEQDTKLPCRCVFDIRPYVSGQFYDKAYVCRGAAITRLLLVNKHVISKDFGCSCEEHNDVFAEKLGQIKKALDLAKVWS